MMLLSIPVPGISQDAVPCQKITSGRFGSTLLFTYPDCADTTSYIVFTYERDSLLYRKESYRNDVLDGACWYRGGGRDGVTTCYYSKGRLSNMTVFYPASSVCRSSVDYLTDSLAYVTTFYPNGNLQDCGYNTKDSVYGPSGIWTEYDSLGFSFWTGSYRHVNIISVFYIKNDMTGEAEEVHSQTSAIKSGTWKKYNLQGDLLEIKDYSVEDFEK